MGRTHREEILGVRRGCRAGGRREPFLAYPVLLIAMMWHNLSAETSQRVSSTDVFMKARRAGGGDLFKPKMQCLFHLDTQVQISKK